jgi:predicted nucleic acid-binding protein
MVSFDTNILVYATLSDPLATTHRARDLLVRGMRTKSAAVDRRVAVVRRSLLKSIWLCANNRSNDIHDFVRGPTVLPRSVAAGLMSVCAKSSPLFRLTRKFQDRAPRRPAFIASCAHPRSIA